MTFDIKKLIKEHAGENFSLYEAHVNPRFARALRIIGFDRCYETAKGAYLWDIEGRRYLDMLSGYGAFNIGRNHPVVRKALCDFMSMDGVSLVQMEAPLLCGLLAGELKNRIGYGLDNVYFCSTGAEGNEAAIKFARCATGKSRIIYASSGFHGLTTGALALNGSQVFKEKFGELLPADKVPFGDLNALEDEISSGDIAAFFVEPIQGKGVNIPPAGYMKAAGELCHKHGVLFVVDEVQTGIGRTGKFLALHHETGAEPDMVIVSKSLSGGYVPIAAVLMKKAIYDKVYSSLDRSVVHSSTFGKSNFAMTAGLATLSVLDDENLMDHATRMGNLLGERLQTLAERYEFIGQVRWRGLMLAIEFASPRSLKLKTAWTTVNKLNEDLFCQAVTIPLLEDHAVLTQVAGNQMTTIKLIPPLCITEDDVDWFITAFDKVMQDLHRFPGPAWESLMRIARNAMPGGRSKSRAAAE
ncbi:MAG: aspartate aminotransferase family protein [Rhizobiales bacterium]|nr:aspartate aminotransferase family protein [Hyphomicrobiales bacterium]